MNDWVSKSLLALALTVWLVLFAQPSRTQFCPANPEPGTCTGGGCGNFRALQAQLEQDTLRFGHAEDLDSPSEIRENSAQRP